MAEYNVTSPDGTKYRVTGPDGASDADVLAQVRGQHDQRALKSGGTPAGPKPPAPAPQEDSALGFTTGNINKGIAGLAGMPVDTARNALNLGIAGAGRLTGTTPSLIGQDSPGGSQWMEQMLRKAGSIGQSAEPTSAVGRYAASALQMAPGAMFSPGRLGQLPAKAMAGATSGMGGELASDIGGEQWRGVGAMAPSARQLTKPPTTSERATTARRDERFQQAKEAGIPVPPREMKPDAKQQAIQDTVNRELQQPAGTEISPKTLQTYRNGHWQDYQDVVKSLKEVKPTPQFQSQIQDIGNEITRAKQSLPQTFKAMDPVIKLLGEYGYAPPIGKLTVPPRSQPIPTDVAMRAVKKLRADATTNFASDNPEKVEMARVQRKIATSLEDLIETNLSNSGAKPEVMQKFRDARTAIAKSHDVESSLDPATRKVSGARLSALLTEGRPLTGGLQNLAEVSGAFPQAVSSKIGTSEDMFTHKMTPMAVTHPNAMAAHYASRWFDPLTTSKPYQEAFVNPRNQLSPEAMRFLRYMMAAQGANQGVNNQLTPPPQ